MNEYYWRMNDERQLVERAICGEMNAFNQLMKNWYKRVFNFTYRYLNNYDEASEMTQQTFIKAYLAMATLKDAGKFRAWLYIIASNLCRSVTRKSATNRTDSLDEAGLAEAEPWHQFQSSDNPEQLLIHQEWKDLLRQALMHLPEEQRLVIIMKEYEELTFREIAEILSESENTVKSRMYYGLKALRKVLTKYNINKETINYEK